MNWDQKLWTWEDGYTNADGGKKVVAIDYGLKRNILRCLTSAGCDVTVVPATTGAADILAMNPDGVFLSNGPGDPAATGEYAVPEIKKLVDSGIPVFGICLGHQMLAIALGVGAGAATPLVEEPTAMSSTVRPCFLKIPASWAAHSGRNAPAGAG